MEDYCQRKEEFLNQALCACEKGETCRFSRQDGTNCYGYDPVAQKQMREKYLNMPLMEIHKIYFGEYSLEESISIGRNGRLKFQTAKGFSLAHFSIEEMRLIEEIALMRNRAA